MKTPSSQVISVWVKETLESESWVLLRAQCSQTLGLRLRGWSEDRIEDLVEKNIDYVAEHLRNDVAESRLDGTPLLFEIDYEQSPYIRLVARACYELQP